MRLEKVSESKGQEILVYTKILGLEQLQRIGFSCPPYTVIDITGDAPADVNEYVLSKIRKVSIPQLKDDRVGVTIRVSLPGGLDKLARHGGLHVIDEDEVLRQVLEKYEQYKPRGKIVVQHTVDARCSGTLLRENDHAVIEAIFGDAPSLLEGEACNYEKWVFFSKLREWKKERVYTCDGKGLAVLATNDIQAFDEYLRLLAGNVYLEWSISKCGELFFYEYCKLNN